MLRSETMAKKKKKGLLIAFIIVLVILAAGAFGALKAYQHYRDFNEAFIPGDDAAFKFEVGKGWGTKRIANALEDAGLIKDAGTFRLKSKLNNLDGKYQAGEFLLSPGMTMEEIMTALQNARRETVRFTIPEGYTIAQIGESLVSQGLLSDAQQFYDACEKDYVFPFLEGVEAEYPDGQEKISAKANRLEGFLFPDTYEIYKTATPEEIVRMMLGQFGKVFEPLYAEHYDDKLLSDFDMTPKKIVTLASLIEKEAQVDADRAKIASVIYNRLKKDWKLQIDATVLYVIGWKDRVLYSDLEVDSPYNTYAYKGLPAGPIGAPGKASLEAALAPENTKYMYYVLKPDGSGEHDFAETEAQFNKYKDEYLKSRQ